MNKVLCFVLFTDNENVINDNANAGNIIFTIKVTK